MKSPFSRLQMYTITATMPFKDVYWRLFAVFTMERPVRNLTIADLASKLTVSGDKLTTRFGGIANRDANREALRHIIGIEKWGQKRLKVFLGYPYERDEYEGYRPPASYSWNDLRDAFAETRRDTVSLARQINQQGGAE